MDFLSVDTITGIVDNIRDFVFFDRYGTINGRISAYTHFFYDIIFLLILAAPITNLVIALIRKIKKKKYMWLIGVKGIIIFIVDFLF